MARYPRRFGSSAARAQSRAAFAAVNGAVPALTITGTPAAATVGSGETFTPAIAGGAAPYSLSVASGALPGGRAIAGLAVSGTYTTAGTFSYTLRATDSKGATADLPITLTVAAASNVLRLTGTGGRSSTGVNLLSSTYTKRRNRSVSTILSDASVVTFVYPIGWYKDDAFQTARISFPTGTTIRAQTDYGSRTATNNFRPAYVSVGDFAVNPPLGVLTDAATSVPCEGNKDYLYVSMTAAQYALSKFAAGQPLCAFFEMDYAAAGGPCALTDSGGTNSTSTSGEAYYQGGTTSIGTGGGLTANGGITSNHALRPIAVIADGVMYGFAADGDSINGVGKDAGRPAGDGSTALSGLMMNGLFQTGRPYTVSGKNGSTCAALAALPITDRQFDIHRWSEVSGVGFSTNDLGDATDNGASLIAAHRQLRAKLASIPTPSGAARKIFATNVPPRTGTPASATANNGTAITGNTATTTQQVRRNYANDDPALVAFHNSLAADLAAGNMNLHQIVDVRTALGDTVQSDRVAVLDGTGNKVQSGGTQGMADGTHPGSALVAFAATEVKNKVGALV